jgi:endonuclease/exonuclease/phosphatase family metal-dependent hydrolase
MTVSTAKTRSSITMRPLLFTIAIIFFAGLIQAQEITVLTWNIRYDNPNDSLDRWSRRKEALAEEVRAHHPAIIGLQEALVHQVHYLDEQWPGYGRIGVGREDGMEKGEFSPVYYDTTLFTLLDGSTCWLSPTPTKPGKGWDAACERIATRVILRDKRTGDSLWIANTHWDHVGQEARAYSAAIMRDLLGGAVSRGRHVILMGDLNATPDDGPIRQLHEWLHDGCPKSLSDQGTFNGFDVARTAFRRIDHVLLSPGNWRVVSYHVPRPMVNGRHMSDHFPVVVRLSAK